MRRLGLIFAVWTGLLLHGANAGTYNLLDGKQVTGVPLLWEDRGVEFKKTDGSLTDVIDWGLFSDEALLQLRNDANTAAQHALVDPLVSDEIPALKAKFRDFAVTLVTPTPRATGHLGILAIFASPLGWFMLLIIYGLNIYAAYEIALFRNQPVQSVCGMAAIPIFGVAVSVFYLANPTRPGPEHENALPGNASKYVSSPPVPLPSVAPEDSPPESTAPLRATAPERPAARPAAPVPSAAPLPAPVIYKRGDFSFNRRFFETKLTGFFRVVLSDADKDFLIYIKSNRGDFVGRRIPRITQSELYLEIFKDEATAEEMIPFGEIMEVQVRHKDLP